MNHEQRVEAMEAKGMTRSDAQGVVDAEDVRLNEEMELFNLLWDYLPKVKGNPDRRMTGYGDKTKAGLLASVRRALGES